MGQDQIANSVYLTTSLRRVLDDYVLGVYENWEEYWKHRYDHPYFRFSTFLGERLMTDFDLRHHEQQRQR